MALLVLGADGGLGSQVRGIPWSQDASLGCGQAVAGEGEGQRFLPVPDASPVGPCCLKQGAACHRLRDFYL